MSKKAIGYKQSKEHFNCLPDTNYTIDSLTTIGTCRYDPEAKKTASMEAFMNRPIRYFFNVTEKVPGSATSFQHSYYFDKKEDAEQSHKLLRLKLYDQKTKRFLNKIENGRRLNSYDQNELLETIDEIFSLKS